MDKSTIIGLVMGFTLVLGAIIFQGSISIFFSISSFVIVVGGIFSSSFSNYSIADVSKTFRLLFQTLPKSGADPRTDIEILTMFAKRIRKSGLLSVEEDVESISDEYLKNGMMLLIDGFEQETVKRILDNQLQSDQDLLDRSVQILAKMAEYAPAFGMIGTVIGLILMLQNISDPETLGVGLSIALLTTLYGTIMANMIFNPLSGKLDFVGSKQINRRRLYRMGIMCIIAEDNPRVMESKLINLLAPDERTEFISFYEKNRFGKQKDTLMLEGWKNYQDNSWQKIVQDLAALGS